VTRLLLGNDVGHHRTSDTVAMWCETLWDVSIFIRFSGVKPFRMILLGCSKKLVFDCESIRHFQL